MCIEFITDALFTYPIKGDAVMRTLMKNGKIFIEKGVFQQAVIIEDGWITAVGSNNEMSKFNTDITCDLDGKTVLPGFNDSHLHMMMTGEAMSTCNLSGARSIDDIIQLGKAFLDKHPTTKILKGRGWNQDYFKVNQRRLLTRHDLDKICTDIPIVFTRACSHVAACNTKSIEALNINHLSTVDGGTIGIGNDGLPNGIFQENAITLLNSLSGNKTKQELENEFNKANEYALSVGITSVQSCDVLKTNFDNTFSAIHSIYSNTKKLVRYRHQFNFQRIKEFEAYLEGEFITGQYDDQFLSRGCLKLFKDGSLGGRSAYMLSEYNDDPKNRGIEVLSDDQFQTLCDLATKNNIQIVTHAIGDAAVESVINAYEKTMKDNKNPLRHTIIHFQITNSNQLTRASELKIPIIYQPIFLDYDHKIVESRVGVDLANTSYAFNTMYMSDSSVSFSSDSPIEDCNPMLGIYCAVTRMGLDGTPKEGFNPKEKMGIEEAVDAYTYKSAYNEFKENTKGKLKPGYVADLIILDQDIFSIEADMIKDIKVSKTMINGEFVYER